MNKQQEELKSSAKISVEDVAHQLKCRITKKLVRETVDDLSKAFQDNLTKKQRKEVADDIIGLLCSG